MKRNVSLGSWGDFGATGTWDTTKKHLCPAMALHLAQFFSLLTYLLFFLLWDTCCCHSRTTTLSVDLNFDSIWKTPAICIRTMLGLTFFCHTEIRSICFLSAKHLLSNDVLMSWWIKHEILTVKSHHLNLLYSGEPSTEWCRYNHADNVWPCWHRFREFYCVLAAPPYIVTPPSCSVTEYARHLSDPPPLKNRLPSYCLQPT